MQTTTRAQDSICRSSGWTKGLVRCRSGGVPSTHQMCRPFQSRWWREELWKQWCGSHQITLSLWFHRILEFNAHVKKKHGVGFSTIGVGDCWFIHVQISASQPQWWRHNHEACYSTCLLNKCNIGYAQGSKQLGWCVQTCPQALFPILWRELGSSSTTRTNLSTSIVSNSMKGTWKFINHAHPLWFALLQLGGRAPCTRRCLVKG
jgi:hypothetical protein